MAGESNDRGNGRIGTLECITLAEMRILRASRSDERRTDAIDRGADLQEFAANSKRISGEQIVCARIVFLIGRLWTGEDVIAFLGRYLCRSAPRLQVRAPDVLNTPRHGKVVA